MEKELNLVEILKGHEGETFYSPLFGDATLVSACGSDAIYPIIVKTCYDTTEEFTYWGAFYDGFGDDECVLFPSKEQRDWNVWLKEQKKKELPKTWEECLSIYKSNNNIEYITDVYKNILPEGLGKPMLALCQLLICREVYRKGWKPDWTTYDNKHNIYNANNEVNASASYKTSCVLSFQSEEIRDKFLENFKDLIEQAKELI